MLLPATITMYWYIVANNTRLCGPRPEPTAFLSDPCIQLDLMHTGCIECVLRVRCVCVACVLRVRCVCCMCVAFALRVRCVCVACVLRLRYLLMFISAPMLRGESLHTASVRRESQACLEPRPVPNRWLQCQTGEVASAKRALLWEEVAQHFLTFQHLALSPPPTHTHTHQCTWTTQYTHTHTH